MAEDVQFFTATDTTLQNSTLKLRKSGSSISRVTFCRSPGLNSGSLRRARSESTLPIDVATSTSFDLLVQKPSDEFKMTYVDTVEKTRKDMNELHRILKRKDPCLICKMSKATITIADLKKKRQAIKQGGAVCSSRHDDIPRQVDSDEPSEVFSETWTPQFNLYRLMTSEYAATFMFLGIGLLLLGLILFWKAAEYSVMEYVGLPTPRSHPYSEEDSLEEMWINNNSLPILNGFPSVADEDSSRDQWAQKQDEAATKIQRWFKKSKSLPGTNEAQGNKKRLDRLAECFKTFFSKKKLVYLKDKPINRIQGWMKRRHQQKEASTANKDPSTETMVEEATVSAKSATDDWDCEFTDPNFESTRPMDVGEISLPLPSTSNLLTSRGQIS